MEENISDAGGLTRKISHGLLKEMWQEACERGRSLSFQMASGSMSPMIKVGDVVRVGLAEPASIRIGDIVAFQDGQNVVVHRVIGKSSSNATLTFRHRGDAGVYSGKIEAQNLIGKVTAIEKEGYEICLNSRRHIIGNILLGWRLQLVDTFSRMQHQNIGTGFRLMVRPMWRLFRGLLLWHL